MFTPMKLFRARGKALGTAVLSRNYSSPRFIKINNPEALRYTAIPQGRRRNFKRALNLDVIIAFRKHIIPEHPRKPLKAYISFGSNVGDRVHKIEQALKGIEAGGVKITRTSSLWETEPMYDTDQPQFLNGVCEVSSQIFSRTLSFHKSFVLGMSAFRNPSLVNGI